MQFIKKVQTSIGFGLLLLAIAFAAKGSVIIAEETPSNDEISLVEKQEIRNGISLHKAKSQYLINMTVEKYKEALAKENDKAEVILPDRPLGSEEDIRSFMLEKSFALKAEVCLSNKGTITTNHLISHCGPISSKEHVVAHTHPIIYFELQNSDDVGQRTLNYVPSPYPNDATLAEMDDRVIQKIYTWTPHGEPTTIYFKSTIEGPLEISVEINGNIHRWLVNPFLNILARLNLVIEKKLAN